MSVITLCPILAGNTCNISKILQEQREREREKRGTGEKICWVAEET